MFKRFLSTGLVFILLISNFVLPALAAEGEYGTDYMLSDCEKLEPWTIYSTGTISLDTQVFAGGKSSVKVTSYENKELFFYYNWNDSSKYSFDFTNVEYLEYDLYIEDTNIFKYGDCGINIYSGAGTANAAEYATAIPAATFKALTLTTGWNHIKVPINYQKYNGANFDITDVRRFRIYIAGLTGINSWRIDNFRAVGTEVTILPEPENSIENKPPVATGEEEWVISGCNSLDDLRFGYMDNLETASVGADTFIKGDALAMFGIISAESAKLKNNPISIDKYGFDELALRIQLYIEDAGSLNYKDGQIELTSGGTFDANELHWNISSLTLKDGWNDLYLSFSEGELSNGNAFTVKNINYFRIYLKFTADTVVAFDEIKVVRRTLPAFTENFEDQDAISKWAARNADISIDSLNFKNGGKSMKIKADGNAKISSDNYSLFIASPDRTPVYFYLKTAGAQKISELYFLLEDQSGNYAKYSLDVSLLSGGDWVEYMVVPSDYNEKSQAFSFLNIKTVSFNIVSSAAVTVNVDQIYTTVRTGKYWRDWLEDYTVEPGDYSMVVIPDIQELTALFPQKLTSMIQWIADSKKKENIKFALGLGDLTWNGHRGTTTNEAVTEFSRAAGAFKILEDAGIYYSNAYGNHDYVPGPPRDTSIFNTYFPWSKFSQWPCYGGAMAENKSDNMYFCFTVGAVKYMSIALEYEPSAAVLDWANSVVASHPDYNVIVTIHGYLNMKANRINTIAERAWKNFISQHSNIFLVLCGHEINTLDPGSTAYRVDEGVHGNPVHQLMVNAQDIDGARGGVGMLMVMRFTNMGKTIDFNYYSPLEDASFKTVNQFTLTIRDEDMIYDQTVLEKVMTVSGAISKLPGADKVVKGDYDSVKAAETEYNALSEDERLFVASELRQKLFSLLDILSPSGDVNGDGEVTAADALLALQCAVKKISLDQRQTAAADVNADGDVTAADALKILQFSVGKIREF